jgi:hypothetical protein
MQMKPYMLPHALAILLSGSLAACSPAPEAPAATYRGTMTSGCAPHDAPSTELQLESTDGASSVWFNLWPTDGIAPPSTVEFDTQHAIGQGAYCTSPEDCEPAAWGRVTLENPGGSGIIEGEWTLGLADGQIYRGRFIADWLAIQALCG